VLRTALPAAEQRTESRGCIERTRVASQKLIA
jgi:hypothetical protein